MGERWFAWYPVVEHFGDVIWLQWVERSKAPLGGWRYWRVRR